MTFIEEAELLQRIREVCKARPDMLHSIVSAATTGVVQQEREMREHACDMETIAAVAFSSLGDTRVTKKTKEYFERLCVAKLDKYADKTFMCLPHSGGTSK